MKTPQAIALASILALGAATTGCYNATIHLADGPGVPSPTASGTFHLNLIDLIEITSPTDLRGACNGGQAVSIDEGLSVLGAVVNLFLSDYFPILSVMNSTVNCGGGGGGGAPVGPPAGPPGAGDPPPPAGY